MLKVVPWLGKFGVRLTALGFLLQSAAGKGRKQSTLSVLLWQPRAD